MTAPAPRHPFETLVRAFQGVGKMVDWLAEDKPSAARALPAAGAHCKEPPPAGWRCVLREPHARCVLEKVGSHAGR